MTGKEDNDSIRSSRFCALSAINILLFGGAALGGGLEMALSCDLRICGEDVVVGLPETGFAIIPGVGTVFNYLGAHLSTGPSLDEPIHGQCLRKTLCQNTLKV